MRQLDVLGRSVVSTLRLSSLGRQDGGRYGCEASNGHGTASHDVVLTVVGKQREDSW